MALKTLFETFNNERATEERIDRHIEALESMDLRDAVLEAAGCGDEAECDDEALEAVIDNIPETDEDDAKVDTEDDAVVAAEMYQLESLIPETIIQ